MQLSIVEIGIELIIVKIGIELSIVRKQFLLLHGFSHLQFFINIVFIATALLLVYCNSALVLNVLPILLLPLLFSLHFQRTM